MNYEHIMQSSKITLSVLCFSQIAELCHEIEDRDDALAKAREAAHKAQLQKYQACQIQHSNRPKPY